MSQLPIVTFQNGLASESIALRSFANVYGASILTPARYTETGKVVVGGHPQVAVVTIGRYPHGTDAIADRLAADLSRADYIAETTTDIRRWKAAKLTHNVRNVLELFDGSDTLRNVVSSRIVEEAKTVLAAAGYSLASPAERKVSIADWRIAENSGINRASNPPGRVSSAAPRVKSIISTAKLCCSDASMVSRHPTIRRRRNWRGERRKRVRSRHRYPSKPYWRAPNCPRQRLRLCRAMPLDHKLVLFHIGDLDDTYPPRPFGYDHLARRTSRRPPACAARRFLQAAGVTPSARQDYDQRHIRGARFFDIDQIADTSSRCRICCLIHRPLKASRAGSAFRMTVSSWSMTVRG